MIKVYDENSNTFEHGAGLFMAVDDGHLVITDGSHQIQVAVYAPGSWERAEQTT